MSFMNATQIRYERDPVPPHSRCIFLTRPDFQPESGTRASAHCTNDPLAPGTRAAATGSNAAKTGANPQIGGFPRAANDNLPPVTDDLPAAIGIVAGEIEILETYLCDLVAELVAANDNEKP